MTPLLTFGVLALTWAVLRGGLTPGPRRVEISPSHSLTMSLIAVVLAVVFYGPAIGIALIVTIAIHEFGHVAAFRVAGHPDASWRLIPLIGGVASSSKRPRSDAHDLFIVAMGPGICLGLSATCLTYAALYPGTPLGDYAALLGRVSSLINFLNLLPIFPLDGGRFFLLTVGRIAPGLAMTGLRLIAAAMLLWGIIGGNALLFLFGMISLLTLTRVTPSQGARQLSPGEVWLGLGAWAAMLGSFGLGAGF